MPFNKPYIQNADSEVLDDMLFDFFLESADDIVSSPQKCTPSKISLLNKTFNKNTTKNKKNTTMKKLKQKLKQKLKTKN